MVKVVRFAALSTIGIFTDFVNVHVMISCKKNYRLKHTFNFYFILFLFVGFQFTKKISVKTQIEIGPAYTLFGDFRQLGFGFHKNCSSFFYPYAILKY